MVNIDLNKINNSTVEINKPVNNLLQSNPKLREIVNEFKESPEMFMGKDGKLNEKGNKLVKLLNDANKNDNGELTRSNIKAVDHIISNIILPKTITDDAKDPLNLLGKQIADRTSQNPEEAKVLGLEINHNANTKIDKPQGEEKPVKIKDGFYNTSVNKQTDEKKAELTQKVNSAIEEYMDNKPSIVLSEEQTQDIVNALKHKLSDREIADLKSKYGEDALQNGSSLAEIVNKFLKDTDYKADMHSDKPPRIQLSAKTASADEITKAKEVATDIDNKSQKKDTEVKDKPEEGNKSNNTWLWVLLPALTALIGILK